MGVRLEIIEDQFSKYTTNQHELSILVGVDSLSYMVTNPQHHVLLLRECTLAGTPLSDFFLQDEYLRLSYQRVKAAISSPVFTFVPTRLYNPAERRAYLQQVATLTDDMDARADDLPTVKATNVYAIERNRLDTIRKFASSGKIFHAATSLLQHLLLINEKKGKRLFIHVYEGKLTLLLLENAHLLFVNEFSYKSAKDFLYYVMLVFEQFKLAPEEVPACATGQLVENSEVFQMVKRYIYRLEMLSLPPFLHFSEKWQQHQPHFFADLFGLAQCK